MKELGTKVKSVIKKGIVVKVEENDGLKWLGKVQQTAAKASSRDFQHWFWLEDVTGILRLVDLADTRWSIPDTSYEVLIVMVPWNKHHLPRCN